MSFAKQEKTLLSEMNKGLAEDVFNISQPIEDYEKIVNNRLLVDKLLKFGEFGEFEFDEKQNAYSPAEKKIFLNGGEGVNFATFAHEIGHAVDHMKYVEMHGDNGYTPKVDDYTSAKEYAAARSIAEGSALMFNYEVIKDAMVGGLYKKSDLSPDVYTKNGKTIDKVIEKENEGDDTIKSSVDFTLEKYENVENLTLIGSASHATGNNLNNKLVGNNLDNTLSSPSPPINVSLPKAPSIYIIDNVNDEIIEKENEGNEV